MRILLLLSLSCWLGVLHAQDSLSTDSVDLHGFGHHPPTGVDTLPKKSFWATYYLVHEAAYADSGMALLAPDSSATGAQLDLCDWCSAAIEGTVLTTDSAGVTLLLNYAGKGKEEQVDCSLCPKYKNYPNRGIRRTRWAPAIGPFGDGVEGYQLVPFRSVAVDPAHIPIGTVLFIPSAVGTTLTWPDGTTSVHDGYFFAADIGGDIKGNHMDVFLGWEEHNPFAFVQSSSSKTFEVQMVKDESMRIALSRAHGR
jgi:3D (Asp-Asp-Asp) domain-containing protein